MQYHKVKFSNMAQFKRACAKGVYIKGGYGGRYNDEWRVIACTQSNGCRIKDSNGDISFFDYPKARDCVIKDNTLKIYEDRVKYGNTDMRADIKWFKYELEQGNISSNDYQRYTKQVAEYILAVK